MLVIDIKNRQLEPNKIQLTTQQKWFKKKLIDLNQPQTKINEHFGWVNTYISDLIADRAGGPAAVKNIEEVKKYVKQLEPNKIQLTPLQKKFKKRLVDLNQPQIKIAKHFGWTNSYVSNLVAKKTDSTNLQKVKDYVGIK